MVLSLVLAAGLVAAPAEIPTSEVGTNAVVAASTNGVDAAAVKTNRIAKITAASTYYDSKEGMVYFSGNVFVDDKEYQLHADRAYVFMDKGGTNELKRIVALGNVAMTNDTKRAYGVKASYYRDAGMVVLYGDNTRSAEVRDEKENPPQVVEGSKIKFWINSEQVEVTGAKISAPVSGGGIPGIQNSLNKDDKR